MSSAEKQEMTLFLVSVNMLLCSPCLIVELTLHTPFHYVG